jgi:hypothetical protein
MVKKQLFSPSGLMNYIRCDLICDYLDLYDDTDKIDKVDKVSSFDYIMDGGKEYEKQVIEQIYLMHDPYSYHILKLDKKDKSLTSLYNETIEAIQSCRYDVILDSILMNNDNSTYGYPDLIVSTRWINKYITDKIVNDDPYVYYIIDIKSSSISLINGGLNMSMNKIYDCYKYQVYIYKEALNKIQLHKPKNNYGFILGKNYKYQENGRYVNVFNPFKTMGLIDYNYQPEINVNYEKNISDAINYKRNINKKHAKSVITNMNGTIHKNNKGRNGISKGVMSHKDHMSRKGLINMKNTYDKNYGHIKKIFAHNSKEITAFYKCGIKQRDIAHKHNIYEYDDKRLTPEKLGFMKNNAYYNIIKCMLKGMHSKKLITIPKNNNVNNWRTIAPYEFFVDFETYNVQVFGEKDINKLYMIGVGYNEFGLWKYKCFKFDVLPSFNQDYEHKLKELIEDFTNFINSFNILGLDIDDYYKNIRLYHWSHIERTLFKKKINLLCLNDEKYNLPWFDLLMVFRDNKNPIIIKNCISFKLKDIIKKLNEYNLLSLKWDDLDDGLLSSYKAHSIYECSISPFDYMQDITINSKISELNAIIKYNEIDCKAVSLLLQLIRPLFL